MSLPLLHGPALLAGRQHGGPSPASTCATVSNRPGTVHGSRHSTASGRGTVSGREEEPQQKQGGFGGLVTSLLFGAASSLDNRGDSTCLKCRGTGTTDCPTCKGAGFNKEGSSNQRGGLRGPAAAMKKALGLNTSKGETHLVTNRCMRCHGFGREPCQVCQGIGFRSPRVKVTASR